jgi:hypothetical protein
MPAALRPAGAASASAVGTNAPSRPSTASCASGGIEYTRLVESSTKPAPQRLQGEAEFGAHEAAGAGYQQAHYWSVRANGEQTSKAMESSGTIRQRPFCQQQTTNIVAVSILLLLVQILLNKIKILRAD